MELDDPYRELGVAPSATEAELKAAWRRLAARWHPDRNASPQALQRIQRINQAIDEIRRARATADGKAAADEEEPSRHAAVPHAVELSMEEAACGGVRPVDGEVELPCSGCAGGSQPPAPTACSTCGGAGRVPGPLWFGWFAPPVTCSACSGAGTEPAACSACAGSGRAATARYRGSVRIPPGVRDGEVLRATARRDGGGEQPLDVRITLRPHALFHLDGDGTVRVELPVDGFDWVAERWIEVPTPYAPRQMRLQHGALTYRLRGNGFPCAADGPRADCIVSVQPLFPAEWTDCQSALLDQLVASNTGSAEGEEGARMRAWQQALAAWHAGRPSTA